MHALSNRVLTSIKAAYISLLISLYIYVIHRFICKVPVEIKNVNTSNCKPAEYNESK